MLEPLNKKETNLIHLVSDAVSIAKEINMDNVRALRTPITWKWKANATSTG